MPLGVQTTSTRPIAEALDVIPTGAALGAEIHGVDLRDLDDAAFARVVQAWHEESVLLFRNQSLKDEDLITFSRRLGDLDWAPIQETGRRFVEGLPEIYIVSNVKVNGEPIGSLGDGEAVWHTDMSYLEVPPKASLLYSLEVPPVGGNTSFCSMYAIYEALPARLKDRIAGLKIKHDGTYNSGGYVRQGVTPTDDPRTSPGAVHPLVCTHPDTGRRMLYLGRRRNAYLIGLELAHSEALLDELWAFVQQPEFTWEHVWRVGDLVWWDNRCTMHRRDADYWETELSRHQWFAGDEFTAADIQMSFPLEAAAARGRGTEGRPKVQAFLERIHARPAYLRALERGGPYALMR